MKKTKARLKTADRLTDAIQREVAPPAPWPQSEAKNGAIYGFRDPVFQTAMAAMTQATWEKISNDFEVMKKRLDDLSAENIQFKQGITPGKKVEEKSPLILLNPV